MSRRVDTLLHRDRREQRRCIETAPASFSDICIAVMPVKSASPKEDLLVPRVRPHGTTICLRGHEESSDKSPPCRSGTARKQPPYLFVQRRIESNEAEAFPLTEQWAQITGVLSIANGIGRMSAFPRTASQGNISCHLMSYGPRLAIATCDSLEFCFSWHGRDVQESRSAGGERPKVGRTNLHFIPSRRLLVSAWI